MVKKRNKPLAILMLSLVILIGAVLWGLVYSQGWIVSLVAFATAYVAIIVYDKFFDVTRNVYIISGVAIVVLNIIASFVSLGIAVAVEAECSLSIAFKALFEVIGDYSADLIRDGLMCVALTILGLVGVKKMYEEKKLKKTMQENSMNAIADSSNTDVVETSSNDKQPDKNESASENEEGSENHSNSQIDDSNK